MSPFSVLDLFKVPDGSSITVSNLIFQKTIRFLFIVFARIASCFLFNTNMSIGNFRKKVCIPNLVLKSTASALFLPMSPLSFPKPFSTEKSLAIIVFFVLLTITF